MVLDFLIQVEGALSHILVKYPDWVLDKEADTSFSHDCIMAVTQPCRLA